MYENDVLSFDILEELEAAAPIKSNKAIKKASKFPEGESKIKPLNTKKKETVATNPVEASCNKCGNKVSGDLIGDIYMPNTDKVVPLISYCCKTCGHAGRRSVIALGLPIDQYERKYFN